MGKKNKKWKNKTIFIRKIYKIATWVVAGIKLLILCVGVYCSVSIAFFMLSNLILYTSRHLLSRLPLYNISEFTKQNNKVRRRELFLYFFWHSEEKKKKK